MLGRVGEVLDLVYLVRLVLSLVFLKVKYAGSTAAS